VAVVPPLRLALAGLYAEKLLSVTRAFPPAPALLAVKVTSPAEGEFAVAVRTALTVELSPIAVTIFEATADDVAYVVLDQ